MSPKRQNGRRARALSTGGGWLGTNRVSLQAADPCTKDTNPTGERGDAWPPIPGASLRSTPATPREWVTPAGCNGINDGAADATQVGDICRLSRNAACRTRQVRPTFWRAVPTVLRRSRTTQGRASAPRTGQSSVEKESRILSPFSTESRKSNVFEKFANFA